MKANITPEARELLRELVDDGQRRCRLGVGINRCPNFEKDIHRRAWKAGYRSALNRVTVDAALATLLQEDT